MKYTNEQLFNINLIITHKNGQPCLMLRRETTDNQIIKTVLQAAFHEKPIIILPTFNNKLQSINTLIEKGIIYKEIDTNKGELRTNYFFNI